MRFLFYSHDGLGLGHTRRHLAIASALASLAPESSILLASGADDALRMGLPAHVEILKLPGLRKVSNDEYYPRRLRIPVAEIWTLRTELLLSTVKSYRPDVLLVDKHPFGVNGEFRDALAWARDRGCRSALGLRDILDEPATVLKEWARHGLQEEVERHYDLMLVYGEQAIFDPLVAYELPRGMAERTKFCGYVVNPEEQEVRAVGRFDFADWRRPIVLGTTGGGEDGFELLENFITAAAEAPWQGMVVAGPLTPEPKLKSLQELADKHHVPLQSFVPSMSRLFLAVDAVVCMGGYNTLAEAISQGVPVVCVPRQAPRAEQVMRAKALERLGLLRMLHPTQICPETLRAAVDEALTIPRGALREKAHQTLSFDGAYRAANQLVMLARGKKASTRVAGKAALASLGPAG